MRVTPQTISNRIDDYPNVLSINTHVIKYGLPKEFSQDDSGSRRMILIIPGNPGVVEFYDDFMKSIHERSGWPVWGISHAGHSDTSHLPHGTPDTSVYTLEGQVQHKVSFINEFIPDDVQLVLVGHSIGAYIILEIMNRLDKKKVLQGYLLFPTIERMAGSPAGKRMVPLLKYMRWCLVLFSAGLSVLPDSWKRRLVDFALVSHKNQTPDCVKKAALNLLNPFCLSNALYMANIEMHEVVHLDIETVSKHLPQLRFYYGATDHWCPIEYFYDVKKLFPSHDHIYLCDQDFKHAFILHSSEPMAKIVCNWLAEISV